MEEHPVEQPIKQIVVSIDSGGYPYETWIVGSNGVTRIEPCIKSGLYSNLPYIRVWKDDHCEAEFCQHNLLGVYFGPRP